MSSQPALRASPPPNGSESDSESSAKKQKANEGEPDSKPWVIHEYVKNLKPQRGGEGEVHIIKDKIYDADKEWFSQILPFDPPVTDKACWEKYFKQMDESDGFDIKDFPGVGPMTTIVPMPCSKDSKDFAAKALVHYNKEHGTKYEFDKVIKVNGYVTAYYNYYITFTVTNTNGEKQYFQAHVEEDIDGNLLFPILRPRVKGDLDI